MLAIILETLVMLGQALSVAALIYGIYLVFQAVSHGSMEAAENMQSPRQEKKSIAANVSTLAHGDHSKETVSYRRVA